MKRIARLAIVCGSLIAGACQAQTSTPSRPSPEDMQKQMDTAMGAMVPMMGRMAEVMMEAQLKIAARPETAANVAAFKKNLYEELKKKGFTAEQAMQITLATALPAAAPMGK